MIEKQRLAETGVTVEGGYVDGKMPVSRACGDILDKTGEKILGLISKPELTAIEVKDNTEFVILASDEMPSEARMTNSVLSFTSIAVSSGLLIRPGIFCIHCRP